MKAKNKAICQLLLCSAMWSMAGVMMKYIPWTAMSIASLRSLLAGVVAFLYMRTAKIKFTVNKRSAFGAVALAATMLVFCTANKLTTAANAIVLQFTSPIFVVVLSAIFLKKRFSKADILAVACTFCGIALFFVGKLEAGSLAGNCVALCSGMTLGCYYISLGDATEDVRMSSVVMGHGLTFLAGLPSVLLSKPELSGLPLLLIILLGVFQLGIPYVLLAKGSAVCPPLVCSVMGALEPLLNPVWVGIFYGEMPGPFALIGGIIVISTITLWCVWNGRHEAAQTC